MQIRDRYLCVIVWFTLGLFRKKVTSAIYKPACPVISSVSTSDFFISRSNLRISIHTRVFNSDWLACMSRGSLLPLMSNRIHYSLNMRRITNYCRAVGVGLRTLLLFFSFLSFAGERWKRRREIAIDIILDLVEILWRSKPNNSQWPIDGSCRARGRPSVET